MLSRTADHLYWMARQIERAENLARMLEMHYRHSLLPHTEDVVARDWAATLSSLGQMETYASRCGEIVPARAFQFLAYDRENPASIVSCLAEARENARAIRGSITSEMWETLNSTWLELRHRPLDASGGDIGEFIDWVRYRAHLSRGVTLGTMLRDDAFHFTRIGTFLEGADATTRMLLARCPPGFRPSDEGAGPDAYAWTLLLRSVSAFEVYRKIYRDAVTPRRVAQLLILHDDLPRSLRRCLSEVHTSLQVVSNGQSGETERRAGELHATFRYGRLEDLSMHGLDLFLDGLLERLSNLGWRIGQDFLVPTIAS
jgi:uncharacterized alpha-E superfamily protein